jgi:hypothetical protein
MKVNLGPADRVARGILGAAFLGVGLVAGRSRLAIGPARTDNCLPKGVSGLPASTES